VVLILDIIAPNLLALDSTARRVFDAVGGTIGRDGRSDWVLPNPKISGRHARITYVDSVFYIEDTSTNGVYLNSRRNRLVRGQPCALNSGDRLFIDPYAIQVTVASEQDIVSGHPAVSPQPFDNGDILLETDPFDPFADVHSRRAGSRPAPAPELERDDEPERSGAEVQHEVWWWKLCQAVRWDGETAELGQHSVDQPEFVEAPVT